MLLSPTATTCCAIGLNCYLLTATTSTATHFQCYTKTAITQNCYLYQKLYLNKPSEMALLQTRFNLPKNQKIKTHAQKIKILTNLLTYRVWNYWESFFQGFSGLSFHRSDPSPSKNKAGRQKAEFMVVKLGYVSCSSMNHVEPEHGLVVLQYRINYSRKQGK